MKHYFLKKDQKIYIEKCWLANSFQSKLMGLMGKRHLPENEGMLFLDCNSIHTFFMRISIDVVYLKRQGQNVFQVKKIFQNVKPWGLHWPVFEADSVLEVSAGKAAGLQERDLLCLS